MADDYGIGAMFNFFTVALLVAGFALAGLAVAAFYAFDGVAQWLTTGLAALCSLPFLITGFLALYWGLVK